MVQIHEDGQQWTKNRKYDFYQNLLDFFRFELDFLKEIENGDISILKGRLLNQLHEEGSNQRRRQMEDTGTGYSIWG